MADARKIRDERAGKPPDSGSRGAKIAEGERFEIVELDGGRVQVTIDLGGSFVQHAGTPASVRTRALLDTEPRDRAAINAALAGRG